MIAPMLAAPMSKADIRDWNDWMMEEKYDGHRLVVEVTSNGDVTAYTRERKHAGHAGKSQLTRELPAHLVAEFKRLKPRGLSLWLDGELLAVLPDGRIGTSTDVTRTDLQKSLRFVAFDVLMTEAGSMMMQSYSSRRAYLEHLMTVMVPGLKHVLLAEARECIDADNVATYCHEVWEAGGEGLILKLKTARYTEGEKGRRTCAFVKIKKLFTAVCRVTGWEPTRGTVMNRGVFATVTLEIVEAPAGHEALVGSKTSVKTKDDAELASFERNAKLASEKCIAHPDLGRLLRIEYQDIAADGGVRHPRWDRWENE